MMWPTIEFPYELFLWGSHLVCFAVGFALGALFMYGVDHD